MKLNKTIPLGWSADDINVKSQHSSFELDEFHRKLLQRVDDLDLMHGLLSVVFWGFASGTNGRINASRALARSRAILFGRANASPQAPEDIVGFLKRARDLLRELRISEALSEAMQIKFLQMSFTSKLLTFMEPQAAAVYDEVISLRLKKQTDPLLKSLFVSTSIAGSKKDRQTQAQSYEGWCRWCSNKANSLNNNGMIWVDWNAVEHIWRAVDVERAFFALGRQ